MGNERCKAHLFEGEHTHRRLLRERPSQLFFPFYEVKKMSLTNLRGLGLVALVASTFGAGVMGAACTVNSTGATADGGPATSEGGASDSSSPPIDAAGNNGPLAFAPSNVDLSGIDLTKVGDFVVDNDACTINTESSLASCGEGGGGVLGFKIATQADGSKVAVYVAKSMTILAGKKLTIEGSRPLVFIALDTITIEGALNGNGKGDVAIAGGQEVKTFRTKGAGPGGGGSGTATAGGGGGSYCGVGGAGAAESGTPSPVGAAYGTPEITPLVGGSSGGAGDLGSAGSGGGAIQLVAGTSIAVTGTGLIHVGAGGGTFGGISGQEANGGGSGGSILLESLAVTVAGTLAANGGGGGAGTSSDVGSAPPLDPGGADSTANASPAAGGKSVNGPSAGGSGSAAASVNGSAGSFTAGNSGGGGGGGSGRIRINTKSANATLSGQLSPAASTPCTTQGAVRGATP